MSSRQGNRSSNHTSYPSRNHCRSDRPNDSAGLTIEERYALSDDDRAEYLAIEERYAVSDDEEGDNHRAEYYGPRYDSDGESYRSKYSDPPPPYQEYETPENGRVQAYDSSRNEWTHPISREFYSEGPRPAATRSTPQPQPTRARTLAEEPRVDDRVRRPDSSREPRSSGHRSGHHRSEYRSGPPSEHHSRHHSSHHSGRRDDAERYHHSGGHRRSHSGHHSQTGSHYSRYPSEHHSERRSGHHSGDYLRPFPRLRHHSSLLDDLFGGIREGDEVIMLRD
ncbi:hypothetical protein EV127DRAFT_410586 [Xylaria flabelliformis]|nr:hypothetical protein EV127DRAFT_410586 [Xylaria flabelliformis]